MGIVIQNAKDIDQPYTRWFLYGPTGSGKTTAASTFPTPFFILPKNENSILTIQGRDVDYTIVETRNDMEKVIHHLHSKYNAMLKLFEKGKDDEAQAEFPWQTVVIENLSHYCELLVEDISKGGAVQMNQQSWGLLSNHLRNLHSALCDMDVHTVYTSLDTIDDTGRGRPLMTGKNAIIMPSSCDVIGHCEAITANKKKEPIYRIHFRQDGKFPARSRFNTFPAQADGFNFTDFEPHIGGS